MKIDSFQGQYRWLSNFWPANVFLDGRLFPSVENAYQAAKTHPSARGQFLRCTPGDAKRLGRKCQVRGDWEQVRLDVMLDLVRQKFCAGSELGSRLTGTGSAELIEGNTWGDTFWGVCRGVGDNNLGKILMCVRSEINLC